MYSPGMLHRPAVQTLLLALAYFVAGRLALFLAIPPGYATAVWPSAGIALAGLFLGGARLWPGVLLGSFLINVWTAFDPTSPAAILRSSAVAGAISGGAVLQALAGAWLCRRAHCVPGRIVEGEGMFRFLILGGAVACLIGANVGNATLWSAGLQPAANVPFGTLTWWVGDCIGVLLFAPLLVLWAPPFSRFPLRRLLAITLPILAMFAMVVVLFVYASRWEAERIRLEFARRADTIHRALRERTADEVDVLEGICGLFAASRTVAREDFREYVRLPLLEHPGILALEWVPRVPQAERGAWEASARARGLADFRIWERDDHDRDRPAGERAEHFPVDYCEPAVPDSGTFGFDLGSETNRNAMLVRARDTGEAAASERVRLVQAAPDPWGVLVAAPIYRNGGRHDTVAERRANLAGFAVGVFRISPMIEAILTGLDTHGLAITVTDALAAECDREIYGTGKRAATDRGGPANAPVDFDFAGRRWSIRVCPTAADMAARRSWESWSVLANGLALTGLLGTLLFQMTGRTLRVEREVAERTAALREANQRLEASVREKELLLREVHHRVKGNLQVVSSLLSMQGEASGDDRLRHALEDARARTRSMGLVHERLYQSASLAQIDFPDYVGRLGDDLITACAGRVGAVRLERHMAAVELGIDTAVPLGLIANELISNALKYAFPGGRSGSIVVELKTAAAGRWTLAVRDDGAGYPPDFDPERGGSFGLRLVRLLAEQIGGQVRFSRSGPGAWVEVEFPVNA